MGCFGGVAGERGGGAGGDLTWRLRHAERERRESRGRVRDGGGGAVRSRWSGPSGQGQGQGQGQGTRIGSRNGGRCLSFSLRCPFRSKAARVVILSVWRVGPLWGSDWMDRRTAHNLDPVLDSDILFFFRVFPARAVTSRSQLDVTLLAAVSNRSLGPRNVIDPPTPIFLCAGFISGWPNTDVLAPHLALV